MPIQNLLVLVVAVVRKDDDELVKLAFHHDWK